ncbi:uncharacterized protein [Miscanthus floridulus]|uniref:uncharacterized protein isoform X1 n=1 Tax=Miscanthus floridulus TaxID=154761 RepID=UPI00345AEFA8
MPPSPTPLIGMAGYSPTRRSVSRPSFGCEEGYEAKADAVADKAAKKLVKDMHYEARIQAVIQYHTEILRVRLPKTFALNKWGMKVIYAYSFSCSWLHMLLKKRSYAYKFLSNSLGIFQELQS